MADEVKPPVAADAAKAIEEPTRPADAAAETGVAEAKPADGGDVATSGEAVEEPKPSSPKLDATADEATAGEAKADTEKAGDDTVAAPAADSAATNGTPASTKKGAHNRRKSGASVPEHKKKTPKKGKVVPELRLNVQPGEMYAVAMKGYPPWPVIVCDEEMLPESLLSKRPVSAKRIDGTYREDFRDDGKNAKDRRYPVMFLGTNEFSWEVNTHLQSIDIDEIKKEVESGNSQKKTKALWSAYEVAAEGHDLQYFKDLLVNHEQALQADAEEKAAKQEKKAKRKSTAAEEVEDVEMEDADENVEASTKKKQSKKRKKDVESDGETEKPAKTPKTKLKLNNKPPKDASASKPKKESKPKKAKASSESAEAEPAKVEEKPLTEAERREKQEKSVLYLRHRLQKGFLARDQAPKEEEMANMDDYLRQLETFENLEAETIRKTKVHKVLKAIVKLNSIPKEDEFNFKSRSSKLLVIWSGQLAAEEPAGEASTSVAEPTTNGVNHDDEKKEDITSPTDKPVEPAKATEATTGANGDGDVSMTEAKDEKPAEPVETVPSTQGVPEAAVETAAA